MRAFNPSGYPWFGMNPPDEELRQSWDQIREGSGSRKELEGLWDQMTTVVIAEQSRAFIDLVTDGLVRRENLVEWFADGLTGCSIERSAQGDHKLDITQAEGTVREGWLSHPWAVAEDIAQKPLLSVFPGVIEFFDALNTASRDHTDALASWTRLVCEQITELLANGARYFHIEEPRLTEVDEAMRMAALEHARRCFQSLPENAVSLLSYRGVWSDSFEKLPGTLLYLDLVGDPQALQNWSASADSRGVALGVFDHTAPVTEDAVAVAETLAPHAERLRSREVWVGPNGSLAGLHRDDAFDKLLQVRYLVEEWNQGLGKTQ